MAVATFQVVKCVNLASEGVLPQHFSEIVSQ